MVATVSPPKVIEITNKKNNVTYLYEDRYYWDPDKKQTRHIRRCIGKLDSVTGQRIYNPTYKAQLAEQGGAESTVVPTFSLLGLARLQEYVEQQGSLKRDLTVLFGQEKTEHLLYLAWYLLCNRRPLSYALYWQQGEKALYQSPSDAQAIQQTLVGIDAELLRIWQSQQAGKDQSYAVFDLCSVASYENHNSYLQYGDNRDSEALEQNSIVLLTSCDRFMPLSFQLLGGTMLTSKTISEMLSYLDVGDASLLMLNRRFFSLARIEELLQQKRFFLMRIPTRQRWLDELIKTNRAAIVSGKPIVDAQNQVIKALSLQAPFFSDEHLTVHLFFDEHWRNNQKGNLFSLLAQCKRELEHGETIQEHARLYETYFTVRKRSKAPNRAVLHCDPAQRFEASHAGFWALVTNTSLSSQQALAMYEKRNAFERRFDNLLNYEDCQNLEVHGQRYYPGRVFLQLVSEQIRTVLCESLQGSGMTIEQVLFALCDLQEVSFGAQGTRYCGRLSPVQKKINELLHLGLEEPVLL